MRKGVLQTAAPAAATSDQADEEMPDAPETEGNSAAPMDADVAGKKPRCSIEASAITDMYPDQATSPPAVSSGRTLRNRTVRQTAPANAIPATPSRRSLAIARRNGVLPPSERTVRGQRGGIIELPYIADPRLQRARPPTDAMTKSKECSGRVAHASNPCISSGPYPISVNLSGKSSHP